MDKNRIFTLIRKDWKELSQSKQAVLPMVLLPIIFCVVMPVIMVQSMRMAPEKSMAEVGEFLASFPPQSLPQGLSKEQQLVFVTSVYFLAPFFLIIPVMVSSVIAASSFVGEKERKTLEGLLYTPLTDKEIILGKMLVAFLPSLLISLLSFAVYTVILYLVAYPVMGYLFFPTGNWWILILGLSPAVALLALMLIMYISQKSATVWEAQQVSAFLVLPIVGLVVAQASGVLIFSVPLLLLATLVVLLLDAGLFLFVLLKFNREKMVRVWTQA